jgi:hypothetical protein
MRVFVAGATAGPRGQADRRGDPRHRGGPDPGMSSIVNPGKLRHLGPLIDLSALRRERS